MNIENEVVDRKVFETLVHSIGDWLDERHLDISSQKYFALAKVFYEHFAPDSSGDKDEREKQMLAIFEEQFVLADSFSERERQSAMAIFQRISHVVMIAAVGGLVALLFSSILGAVPITKFTLGLLFVGGSVSFIAIPILRRFPRDKERVRKRPPERCT